MGSGSTPVDKSNVLEVKIELWLVPVGKSNVFKLQNYENTIFTILLEARALVV